MKKYKQWKILKLPKEEIIFIASSYQNGESLDIYDTNHNIFKVNSQNEIIWQVMRDDSNHSHDWWDILNFHARERGEDGARYPFTYMELQYPDGSCNRSPQTGSPPDEAIWTPDCTIALLGSAYQIYILDPETGMAKNVTKGRPRPW